jgi:NAD(P)H dehydrogenase (quinone)
VLHLDLFEKYYVGFYQNEERVNLKISIIYYSKTGKTKAMAEETAKGMESVDGVEVRLFDLENIDMDFFNASQAVVFGTPTYYANVCWQIKKWFDEGGRYNLAGKLGAAYATANVQQGGGSIAITTLLQHMMVKGMMVYSGGTANGQPFIHLGAVGLRDTFEQDKEMFRVFGQRIAAKAVELFEK